MNDAIKIKIMETISSYMVRNHYCCGCYYDEAKHSIHCYIVKDYCYTMTRLFNTAWITEDTKWVDILAAINHFVNTINNEFSIYQREHFTEISGIVQLEDEK